MKAAVLKSLEYPAGRNDAGGLYLMRARLLCTEEGNLVVQMWYDAPWQVGGSHRWEKTSKTWAEIDAQAKEAEREFGQYDATENFSVALEEDA